MATSDKFLFNAEFTCPLRKVRIPMPSLDESHSASHIEEDRSIAIEAAIVGAAAACVHVCLRDCLNLQRACLLACRAL